jgi:exopolyphosphatase / guanosine-5'-triphosphate,3'-diphosphate pyrophosphatase
MDVLQSMRVGIIDMGSNTFNFLVAHIGKNGHWSREFVNSIPVFIGKNAGPGFTIQPDRMARALDAVGIHANNALNYDCEKVIAFGTAFMRKASNASSLTNQIRKRFKVDVHIITGLEEAAFIYRGIQLLLPTTNRTRLIMDIGGGSVEFIIDKQGEVLWKQSFETGVSLLSQMREFSDPFAPDDIQFIKHYFEETTGELTGAAEQHRPKLLVGSAGSFDTIAAVISASTGKNRLEDLTEIKSSDFKKFSSSMLEKNAMNRAKVRGMEPGRVHSMPIACLLIDSVLSRFKLEGIQRTAYSMREGIADALASGEWPQA